MVSLSNVNVGTLFDVISIPECVGCSVGNFELIDVISGDDGVTDAPTEDILGDAADDVGRAAAVWRVVLPGEDLHETLTFSPETDHN